MAGLTRRSLINSSLGLVAAGSLARPFVANAQAKTAMAWLIQGFAQEEDIAMKRRSKNIKNRAAIRSNTALFPTRRCARRSYRQSQAALCPIFF